jgi:hypothetical protein
MLNCPSEPFLLFRALLFGIFLISCFVIVVTLEEARREVGREAGRKLENARLWNIFDQ